MENQEDEFANLLGKNIKKLKTAEISPVFYKSKKEKNFRLIAAQEERKNKESFAFKALNFDLEERQFLNFCQGRVRVDRYIDLHGFFVDEALRYLQDIISERHHKKLQFWEIVHGKGRNSQEEISPLKIAVWDFLKNNSAISAIAPIADFYGESGAVLIAVKAKTRKIY